MTAPLLGSSALARTTLVLGIACVYAGAVLVNNNLLFPWLERENFRSLLFLPAGLKLFLVMVLGWRAVLGIALGIMTVMLSEFPHMSTLHGLLLGAFAALSTQITLILCARVLRVGYPWATLSWPALCLMALAVGVVDASVVQGAMVWLGYEDIEEYWAEALQGAFGRVLGTFVFLAVSLEVRRHLLRESGPDAGD